jgi:hypothetical protein
MEGTPVSGRRHPIALPALTVILLLSEHAGTWTGATVAAAAQIQTSAAESGVRDLLRRYSMALESLDAAAVKKVQPSLPAENLAKAFKDMRELKVTIEDVRVLSTDGSMARVSCRVTQTLTPKAGSKQTTTVTRVMRLRRDADMWLIDGFER